MAIVPNCPLCGGRGELLSRSADSKHWRCGDCGHDWVEDDGRGSPGGSAGHEFDFTGGL